uniref:Uncharacterized protein n=1 Tax=Anopheles culicifacies TaxID=139723 RepID=A0A182MNB9_9DIPT
MANMERPERKGSCRVSNQQLLKMVSYLETAPHVANNTVRGPQTVFWRKVTKDLNDIGPTVRDATTWKRVWFDYKFSVKKRVRKYNEDIAAGIYPKHLSPIHKRIIKLLDLEVKNAKIMEDYDSNSEGVNGDETTQFKNNTFNANYQPDSNVPASIMNDASDSNINPPSTRSSPGAINACQKRIEQLPNITITKQKHDIDPLANGTNSYSGEEASKMKPRKRLRDVMIQKALDTNKAMLAAINSSITSNKELSIELRAVKQTCEELNENFKNVNSTLRELIEALKKK